MHVILFHMLHPNKAKKQESKEKIPIQSKAKTEGGQREERQASWQNRITMYQCDIIQN